MQRERERAREGEKTGVCEGRSDFHCLGRKKIWLASSGFAVSPRRVGEERGGTTSGRSLSCFGYGASDSDSAMPILQSAACGAVLCCASPSVPPSLPLADSHAEIVETLPLLSLLCPGAASSS
jgi:hypothetical protein